MTVVAELDSLIQLLEAQIPGSPNSPANLKRRRSLERELVKYFNSLEDAFPYSKLSGIYNRYVKESLGSDTSSMLDPILATFDSKLKTDVAGQLAETHISGTAEMVSWGKTMAGVPIAYEGPPIQRAIDWAEKQGATLVTGMNAETKERLARTISQGIENKRGIPGLARDIKTEFADMSRYRSQLIARTETTNALSQASLEAMGDMGIEGKEWVTAGDALVSDECDANEAQGVIPVDREFVSGTMAPPQHPDCRCTVSPSRLPPKEKPPTEPVPRPPTKAKPGVVQPPRTLAKGQAPETWAKSASRDELRAVNYWKGSGYEDIRLAQQTGKAPASIKGAIKDLNRVLDRAQAFDGTVYRGLNNLPPKTFNAIKNAKTFKWDALASSAKTEKAAARFLYSSGNNQSVMFKIVNKTGIDLTSIVGKQEAEVLLRQGAKYRVVSSSEKTYATVAGRTRKALEMVLEEI